METNPVNLTSGQLAAWKRIYVLHKQVVVPSHMRTVTKKQPYARSTLADALSAPMRHFSA